MIPVRRCSCPLDQPETSMSSQHSSPEAAPTADIRIQTIRELLSPAALSRELPASQNIIENIKQSRHTISRILSGKDKRLLVIVGPCSIHDPDSALEYARRLKTLSDELQQQLYIVLRVYFEKPRTVIGWKGLINDPDLDNSFDINKGLNISRKLLIDIGEIGFPAATEFLDTTLGQYYAELISWGAIGARTVESQVHRELASGLSMPIGLKNRTDGDVRVAIDAINAARHSHWFPSLTHEGAPAILETTGNPDTHLILRGGDRSGPNYDAESIALACEKLNEADLAPRLMVDCNHANSAKDPLKQIQIAQALLPLMQGKNRQVFGLMIESHLLGGRQDMADKHALTYGQSITDACLGFSDTEVLLRQLASSLT
jgi:3-deoxy-7-phosphoheptulonate synthase